MNTPIIKVKVVDPKTVRITYEGKDQHKSVINIPCKSRTAAIRLLADLCFLFQDYTKLNLIATDNE